MSSFRIFPSRLVVRGVFSAALLSAIVPAIIGCGSRGMMGTCTVTALNVTPASMSVDHMAAPPGNSQMFSSSNLFTGNGVCTANTSALVTSNWTASDPSVHLSSTPGTQVAATCTAALANPVTITASSASGQMLTGQAMLTCK